MDGNSRCHASRTVQWLPAKKFYYTQGFGHGNNRNKSSALQPHESKTNLRLVVTRKHIITQ